MIPFNKPFLVGKELDYIKDAVTSGKISGNGIYTKKCQDFFESKYGIKKSLMTTSCTDALEMSAILANIEPGDEVIVPSFTFVSTAVAFVRQGANIIFADSYSDNPNIDASKLDNLITRRTKAIVVVHYAGIACDMDAITSIANRHNLLVIEDAAQGIDSYYIDNNGAKRPLGSIGDLAAFSFHETKNIISGEGGLLAVNNKEFLDRSEIIWEKGTNRSQFFRGEVNKYGWVDTGSSFLPSEIISAFLWAQLENMETIQKKRKLIWNQYQKNLSYLCAKNQISLPNIPKYASNNAHMYYVILKSIEERTELISFLKTKGIHAVFHYLSLCNSPYYSQRHKGGVLPNAEHFENCLLRLPLYFELDLDQVDYICSMIEGFYNNR